jgi:carboxylesterase
MPLERRKGIRMDETMSAGRDNQHAVILLHGLCGTPAELGATPKALGQFGYTVSALEIAGYSSGLGELPVQPSWEKWSEAVDDEIGRLYQSHDTVSICGLSMGATLGLVACTQRTDVLSIVALSPMLRYDGWAIGWYMPLLQLAYWLGFRDWHYREKDPFGIRNVEMRRRVARALEKDGVAEVGAATIPARYLNEANKMMAVLRKSLDQVESDLLVVHAIDDETTAPRNSQQILREVQSGTRKGVWLGDCYHIVTFDNEREIVTNEAIRFIQNAILRHRHDHTFRRLAKRSSLRDRR